MPRRRRRLLIIPILVLSFLTIIQIVTVMELEITGRVQENQFRDKREFLDTFGSAVPFPKDYKIKILIWTDYFTDENWLRFNSYSAEECPAKCMVDFDRAHVATSDVILFHARDLLLEGTMPIYRHPNQIYTLVNLEPPWYVFLDLKKYSNVFNWTSFIRRDSDFPSYHSKIVPKTEEEKNDLNFNQIKKWLSDVKTEEVAWLASNCYTQNAREFYVDELANYINIDYYGKCGFHNSPCPFDASCGDIINSHKFYLAFENNNCRDYITEKFWRSLAHGTLPVVMGGKGNYEKVAPPGSYIDSADFDSPRELASYLKRVSEDPELYSDYFRWIMDYSVTETYWCDLCQALHDWDGEKQAYRDLAGWLEQDTCAAWNLLDHVVMILRSWAWRPIKYYLGL